MFENRALRRMFGSMKREAKGGQGKLHNDEFHNLSRTNYYYVDKNQGY
jgi:hypothetical protein